jgi:hypothetical protein
MEKTVKIYNINSAEASRNMLELLKAPYFYWDIKSFINDEPYSEVFFICERLKKAFYAILENGKLPSTYNSAINSTSFSDNNFSYTAAGEWGDFVKFKIIDEVVIPDGWAFQDRLGNQNPVNYLYKSQSKLNEIPKRIQKLEDLKKIFKTEGTQNRINEVIQLLGEQPENRNMENEMNENMPEPQTQKTPKEIIEHSFGFITNSGFQYLKDEIANFYLSLRAKPFVILAGISGTGKTQLPRKFAASLGFSKEQVIQLPVRPDWTDSSDLLGYTSLDGNFIPKDLTLAIQKATANPTKPYFFILDEMNLARVEHYFSDYLSVIETRERVGNEIKTDPILREEILNTAKNKKDFSEMGLPQNLYLIGTVNMDETTHAFSKKVLDRANSIEMNEVDLSWITNSGKRVLQLANISNDLFKTVYLHSVDLNEADKETILVEMSLLKSVNKILEKADLHFAYRVRDEIAFYLILNNKYELMNSNTAFDFQLVQKVLPRIHGSSERVQTVLVELLNLLEGKDFRTTNFEFSMLNGNIDVANLKYRRTSKKIIFMLKRFDDDRFTSFWL